MSNNENKNGTTHFFRITPSGIRIRVSYIVFTCAIIGMGLFFFNYWYFLIIIVTTFTMADYYFGWFTEYEDNHLKISIFNINKTTDNDFFIMASYFIGVLVSGLVALGVSLILTYYKPIIHSFFDIPIVAISILVTALVAFQINSELEKTSNNHRSKNNDN